MALQKIITLKTADQKTFEVEEGVAVMSVTLRNMIEDGYADSVIPLPNVTSDILSKVLEYCERHKEDGSGGVASPDELKRWDEEFGQQVDLNTLFKLIMGADYLNIKSLLDLTCQSLADTIKGMTTVEEIRQTFNIENDFTPEEEAEVWRENQWAFE